MDTAQLTTLVTEALSLALWVSLPVLAAGLFAGAVVGLLQAATQVQDPTLSFVPKLAAVALALVGSGAWMGERLVRFTTELWQRLPG